MLFKNFFAKRKQQKQHQHMLELIKKGIIMEDEFIEMYLQLVQEPEYIGFFSNDLEKNKQKLETLINESKWHKASLEKILAEVGG